jgi:predicted ribosomally synthesized peptide with nif11-like leader
MSNAQAFLDRVESDPQLQAKLQDVGWKSTAAVAIAAAAGFTVTAPELEAASDAKYGSLSTSDLDKASGSVQGATSNARANAIVHDNR